MRRCTEIAWFGLKDIDKVDTFGDVVIIVKKVLEKPFAEWALGATQ